MLADGLPAGRDGGRQEHTVSANAGRLVPVRGRGPIRAIQARLSYGVRQPDGSRWEAQAVSYAFRAMDARGVELLVYHLHPWVPNSAFPHLHVYPDPADSRITGVHLPTGMVTFGDFVGLLIRDLGVAPLRADWREVLGL